MIEREHIFLTNPCTAIWCGADMDATDLARAASVVIENNVSHISVSPLSVSVIWPWLENYGTEILARFYINNPGIDYVSDMVQNINTAFKEGANGAQIFLDADDLDFFVSQVYVIRDDLFFNKKLYIGIDISTINPLDWVNIFSALKKIRADGLILVLAKDKGDKSDFVGRVYAALQSWNADDTDLHFVVGNNPLRIEQAGRLVDSERQELAKNLRFFVNV